MTAAGLHIPLDRLAKGVAIILIAALSGGAVGYLRPSPQAGPPDTRLIEQLYELKGLFTASREAMRDEAAKISEQVGLAVKATVDLGAAMERLNTTDQQQTTDIGYLRAIVEQHARRIEDHESRLKPLESRP